MLTSVCCLLYLSLCFLQFKRALGGGASADETQFLSVDASALTARTAAEQALAAFEEQQSHVPIAGGTKVQATFWNSQTGQEESKTEVSRTAKSKHQINALATSAAAIEVEMARQRQAGYAKRDAARAKYGW